MKHQASELPLGKPQARKKAPRIAPLLIALTVLFTIIPLYYPSLRYNSNPKKINEASSFHPHSEITLEQNNDQDHHQGEEGDRTLAAPKETQGDDDIAERPPESSKDQEDESADTETRTTTKPPEIDLPSSTESGLAIAESLDKRADQTSRGQEQVIKGKKPARPGGNKERPKRRQHDFGRSAKEREMPARRIPSLSGGDGGLVNKSQELIEKKGEGYCNLFSGEWVPNPEGPYYTNETCWAIQEHQNCMKFGKPDTGFLKWRWKPDGCELPIFDPQQFLEIVRGKSIAFVGDSVARNHMQSLICLLSRVVYPEDVSITTDENKRWVYKDYNFNISMFWAPYLVRSEKTVPNDVTRPFRLYLDEFDEDWTSNIETYDYVIISAGHWFFRPTLFYVDRRLIGCLYCPQENVTHLKSSFSYRRAFRTAFRALNSLDNFKGVTFLRTFAPSHFEGGQWDKGGDCVRTRPFKRSERALDDYNLEMYRIQLEELRIAQKEGRRKGLKFRLFDATQSMLLRPDGHPSKYGHWPNHDVAMANDCVHWCLPGPIDSWNDFLLELLKREETEISFS
ncbi:protein trichome birefringence-like 19 [Coffea eugenioides]|uniref:protein trichome birefringence-like 19 n=1 Tax=Coffea eugenioides TaxID=49369 RepID=UPI000F60DBFA|nr:protein trichome birefringence-like 19 [Coffea eugenioides]